MTSPSVDSPRTPSDWAWLSSMDIRSLALFRVGLGTAVLLHVSPLAAVVSEAGFGWGSQTAAMVLSLVLALSTLALIVGYRTGRATLLTWGLSVLLPSLLSPESLKQDPAWNSVSVFLGWATLVPLGHAWSVDRALDPAQGQNLSDSISRLSTLGLKLQILWLLIRLSQYPTGMTPALAGVTLIALLAWLPSWAWDRWGVPRINRPRQETLEIIYDGDCRFCYKLLCLIRTAFLVWHVPMRPAQSDPDLLQAMESYHSWIVLGPNGEHYTESTAMKHLLETSPLGSPLVFLLKQFTPWFDQAYRWVARHRGGLSKGIAFVTPQRLTAAVSPLQEIIAGCGLLLCLWHVGTSFIAPMPWPLPASLQRVLPLVLVDF